jgi:DEAD/DEAH box helicase domain-containing protein
MRAVEFLELLKHLPDYEDQIVHVEHLNPQMALYSALDRPLPSVLEAALRAEGIERLYTHQAEAVNAARAGQHVLVATGTSSGKTLCYNLPVLSHLLDDPLARALYLYPTKALAQDQMRALRQLTRHPGLRQVNLGSYDGDTPQAARARVRQKSQIVLSNPDMLHMGILPNQMHWASFWRHLRYVVIDEAHAYRGVFGSHVGCVLRRLRRVCAMYGSQPQFILCSATIGNPAQHAEQLTGCPAQVVLDDGAPRGSREFALWNPPYAFAPPGSTVSINSEAARIICELVKAEMRSLTFVKARKLAELLQLYVQDLLRQEQRADLAERVSAYRGGYRAEERRDIERRLFAGELLGVTSTNALELGIDVGHLDATLSVGYPGSIASTWQQAGRAGRGERSALSILMAYDDPLDQYLMRHPQELFDRPHEQALCNPANRYVLAGHALCAAQEKPLTAADAALFGPTLLPLAAELAEQGELEARDDAWLYVRQDHPAQQVHLRSSGSPDYVLLDESQNHALLEQMDGDSALFRIYPGAIYLHRGQSYLISHLDVQRRIALARPVEVDYYTQPREINDVRIVRSQEVQRGLAADVFWGHVRVTQQVIGFQRKRQFSDTLLDEMPLDLPQETIETEALWFEVPEPIAREVAERQYDLPGGLHAVEHVCIGVLPLLALCDRYDIGGLSTPRHVDTDRPQVFIYDGYAGGVGIARRGFEAIAELWTKALDVVTHCRCEAGCPSCIHSPKCGNNNEPLDKAAAAMILERLLAAS